MIFRLSQKLATKIKVPLKEIVPLHDNPFLDWSAHLFVANRAQYILICNTKSMYSTVMPGKGISNEKPFAASALASIESLLNDNGYEAVFEQHIAPNANTARFAKPLNRSVIGSMNQLVYVPVSHLEDDRFDLRQIEVSLNDTLLSAIKVDKASGYGRPHETFKRMVEEYKSKICCQITQCR
ncbi:MAG: hypothetical protein WEB58_17055 [Planctomycetaceae bacterium]